MTATTWSIVLFTQNMEHVPYRNSPQLRIGVRGFPSRSAAAEEDEVSSLPVRSDSAWPIALMLVIVVLVDIILMVLVIVSFRSP